MTSDGQASVPRPTHDTTWKEKVLIYQRPSLPRALWQLINTLGLYALLWYLDASRWKRFSYRIARNPFVLFLIAPLFLFVVLQRFPSRSANRRERQSVLWMDLAIVAMAAGLSALIGLKLYLMIQLMVMAVASSAGVWMFYVQHQFEDVHWERGDEWDFTAAALQGSSYYKLPRILQWFTGNIGFHHVHHLSARIPNYNLERCHRELLLAQNVKPITLRASLRSLFLRLWDEDRKQLVGYRALRARRREQKRTTSRPLTG